MKIVFFFKSRLLNVLLFQYVYKQTFHITRVRLSQKKKRLCYSAKPSAYYYFYMKTKILVGFHICISASLKIQNIDELTQAQLISALVRPTVQ